MKEQEFRNRADQLDGTRRWENTNRMKSLVNDMYRAGYGVAAIGRFLGKDHTTIVHHLASLGYKPKDELIEKNKAWISFKTERKKEKAELKRQKQELLIKKAKEVREKQEVDKKKLLAKTELAKKLYEEGKPLRYISQKIGISAGSVMFYVTYDGTVTPKRKIGRVPVIQMDLSGKEIARFPSVRQAALATGCDIPSIHFCLLKKYKQTHDFMWKKDINYKPN